MSRTPASLWLKVWHSGFSLAEETWAAVAAGVVSVIIAVMLEVTLWFIRRRKPQDPPVDSAQSEEFLELKDNEPGRLMAMAS